MKYAIEKIGYGKRTRYIIERAVWCGAIPVDHKIYKTEDAARAAAEALGIEIIAVGNSYEIATACKTCYWDEKEVI